MCVCILYAYITIYIVSRCIVRGSATTIDPRRNNSPVLGQDLIIRFFPYYSLSSSASSIYGCPDKVNGSALTLRNNTRTISRRVENGHGENKRGERPL